MNGFKKIAAISLVLVILSSFTACQLFASDEETTTTNSDLSFEDLLTMTNQSNEPLTDFDGNILETNAQGEIEDFEKDEEVLSQEDSSTTKPSGNGNGNSGNQNGNSNSNGNGNGNGNGGGSGESATMPQASNFNKLNQTLFSKGVYTIEGTMSAVVNGESTVLPFKIARRGKEQYINAQYSVGGATVGMIVNKTKTYCVLSTFKAYVEIEGLDLSGSDYTGLTDPKTYVSTKKVKIGDDIYICEEVKGSSGYSTYFYFLDGELSRIKFQDATGESLLKIKKIKPTVDESEFSIPKGYRKMDPNNPQSFLK